MARPNENRPGAAGPAQNEETQHHRVSLGGSEELVWFGEQEFLAKCQQNPGELWRLIRDGNEHYQEQIRDLEADVATEQLLNQELQASEIVKDRAIDQMRTQIQTLTGERDSFARQIAQAAIAWTGNARGAGKSAKLDDPLKLSDGRNPRFDDWRILMEQKLRANADRYSTPDLRIAYIGGRCEGKALKTFMNRIRPGCSNPYTDGDDVFEHLKQAFNNPNRVIEANQQFRNLFMKSSDKFHDFLSEFVYLAGEAEISEDDWRDELHYRLIPKLQELTIPAINDPEGTFEQFTSYCSTTANRLEITNVRFQRGRNTRDSTFSSQNPTGTVRNTNCGPTTGPAPKKEEEDKSTGRRLSPGAFRRHIGNGLCFKCHQPGHIAANCLGGEAKTELKSIEKSNLESKNEEA
jgi:hypothetical protein